VTRCLWQGPPAADSFICIGRRPESGITHHQSSATFTHRHYVLSPASLTINPPAHFIARQGTRTFLPNPWVPTESRGHVSVANICLHEPSSRLCIYQGHSTEQVPESKSPEQEQWQKPTRDHPARQVFSSLWVSGSQPYTYNHGWAFTHTHTHTHTHTSVFTTKPMCYTTNSVIYFKIRQDIISKWRQEKKFSENPIYHKTLHSSLKSYCSRSEGRATCILARVKEFPPDSIEIPGLPA
jgi:hypothetical protein